MEAFVNVDSILTRDLARSGDGSGDGAAPAVGDLVLTPRALRLRAPSRWATYATFIASDVAAVGAAALLFSALGGSFGDAGIAVAGLCALFGVGFGLAGLLGRPVMHPAEEMRRIGLLALTLTLPAALALGLAGLFAQAFQIALAGLVLGTSLAVARASMRMLCARRSWWGVASLVLGREGTGVNVAHAMRRVPELGFKPIAVFDEDAADFAADAPFPVLGSHRVAPLVAEREGVELAVVALPGLSYRDLAERVGIYEGAFRRVLVLPAGERTLWSASTFTTGLGYAVQHARRMPFAQVAKRAVDVVCSLVLIVLLAPLWLLIVAAIKLDSPGPALYLQRRMGRGGRTFRLIKFRSMRVGAERHLEELLEADEALRAEYAAYRKLRSDPRITRIGRILRRSSLDELPQLWNVLRGDMSLIGPRAYTPNELGVMQRMEDIILQNRPGLTGLWQVSGRNNLSFNERIDIDVHYTHNWNLWLDVYIFLRTIPVVLTADGAR